MNLPARFSSSVPPPSELVWYAVLDRMERWSASMPLDEAVTLAVRAGARLSGVLGRPPEPFMAMARGLMETVYFRQHDLSVLDRMDEESRHLWVQFQREARPLSRAVFVSAHLGPFQLQMDSLADLPQHILFFHRSYRWGPLSRKIDKLRRQTKRFSYVDIGRHKDIVRAIRGYQSFAFLGDVAPKNGSGRPRGVCIFGHTWMDDFPVRLATRLNVPLYVGGLFHRPTAALPADDRAIFGFDYTRIDPGVPSDSVRAYACGLEKTLRHNVSDWIRFGENESH